MRLKNNHEIITLLTSSPSDGTAGVTDNVGFRWKELVRLALVQKASTNLFVVHAKQDRQKVQETLKDFGEVEELKGANNLLLVHLSKDTASKKTRQSIQKRLGEGEAVHPVIVDESGQHQYPTGEINVRFRSTPSNAQLKKFAQEHKLRLHARNEFVPQQAIFEPVKVGERNVLEVVREISKDKNIQLAWPNTLSRYERI